MRKIFFLLLIACLVSSFRVYSQNPKQFYKVGKEFFENGKLQDAIDQFSKAIDVDPDYEDAFEARALAYETLGNFEEAVEDYEKLAIFNDKNEVAFYNIARMYFAVGQNEKALSNVNKSLDIKRLYEEGQQLKVSILLEMEKYNDALETAKEALRYKESDVNFFNHARVNEMVGLWDVAVDGYETAIRKNKDYLDAYVYLADLHRRRNQLALAYATVNKAIGINKNYVPAYKVRSAVYADQLKYPEAINDISTILLLEPSNGEMFFLRGKYYQGYAQHMNAISDFNKVISLDPENAEAYFNRAFSYEQILRFDDAIKDYQKLTLIAEDDEKAKALLTSAEERLFELNRESEKPEVTLITPVEKDNYTLQIPRSETIIPIVGMARDASNIKEVKVNNMSVPVTRKKEGFEFMTSVDVAGLESLPVEITDSYDNRLQISYTIVRTEIAPPVVRLLAPYASDNDVVYLDSDEPTILVQGNIEDESMIQSIYIEGVTASYNPNERNPGFTAMITIQNKNRFNVEVTDIYGNITEKSFSINREGAMMAAENPMGKTWAVFIENSNYESFASLEGPVKDITMMKSALSRYSVHNFIHKKDMTKEEMEKFFAIELRDLLRSNRVNSLMVWYAGHGKFVNNTGYWVPVDAKRDDEYSYFNINTLKASMQSYPTTINHTLVITDACESGPSFYQAMRAELEERSCNDPTAVGMRSSQVFSSAGYELAVDNSQFTRTFANVLGTNEDACIPIESIVLRVTDAVVNNNQQKPQFGKIEGLEDENGTFFFMTK